MPTRKNKRSRGGNYSLLTLGQAASNLLLPAGLFYAAKRQQRGRSVKKIMRRRRY